MDDKATGEQIIPCGAEEYILRPSYAAIKAIETRGAGLVAVWRKIENEGHIGTLALCLWAFDTDGGGGRNKSRHVDFYGELIVEHGFRKFLLPVGRIISGVIARGATAPAEVAPDGETKSV